MTPPYVPHYAVRQREYATTIRENGAKDGAYEAGVPKKSLKGNQKGNQKSSQKSSQKILALLTSAPDATLAELSDATGLSLAGVKKNVHKLRDANLIRRIGPDKGGHWEVM